MCNSVSVGSAYLFFVSVQKLSANTCTINKHVYDLWTHQSSMLTPVLWGKHEISFINTTKEKDLQHNFEGPMRNDSIGNLLTANIISF